MHKYYSQEQDLGVPQDAIVNFLVNHGYNHPYSSFEHSSINAEDSRGALWF